MRLACTPNSQLKKGTDDIRLPLCIVVLWSV